MRASELSTERQACTVMQMMAAHLLGPGELLGHVRPKAVWVLDGALVHLIILQPHHSSQRRHNRWENVSYLFTLVHTCSKTAGELADKRIAAHESFSTASNPRMRCPEGFLHSKVAAVRFM